MVLVISRLKIRSVGQSKEEWSVSSDWAERCAITKELRDEFLQMEIFVSVVEARVLHDQWRVQYNEFRPPSSLDDLTPAEFAALPCGADSALKSCSEKPKPIADIWRSVYYLLQ
jgi:hypothetical protein